MNHSLLASRESSGLVLLGILFSISAAPRAIAQNTIDPQDTRMLEQPAISEKNIAFAYAGDLWVANRDGTASRRLTSHSGSEDRPRFSPDGAWLAFDAEYDGNRDVYLMPVAGGEPRRLTSHPGGDDVVGFSPDGKEVLFTSSRDSQSGRLSSLFRVGCDGGYPVRYPLPSCAFAALSPDGKKIAYSPLRGAFEQWKNYRGGTASRIWIYDVADRSIVQVPQPEGRCNDVDPMWLGDALYFLSDRAGEFNLFTFEPGSKQVTALTTYADFPIANASGSVDAIVYEQAGWIYVFDPKSRASKRVKIGVAADLVETRPRFVKGAQYLRSAGPSPTGARVAIGFRGEILTLPAEKGDARNLTHTPGANERYPAWSPDGATIAYFSDESGENKIVLAPQDGASKRVEFTVPGSGFYERLQWSPDSKQLCLFDNARAIFVVEVASGTSKKVAQEPVYGVLPTLFASWSPDSRFLAYTLDSSTGFRKAFLYDLASGNSRAITDGLADVSEPVFDAGGKYLYFAASTDAGPMLTWFSQASADVYQTNSLYLYCLAASTPSPFAKESDEESTKPPAAPAASGDEKKPDATPPAPAAPPVPETKIDFDGLEARIVALPVERAFYSNLRSGPDGKLYYLKCRRANFMGAPDPTALARFDLTERKEKSVLDGVSAFTVCADRKKVLLTCADGIWLTALSDTIDKSKGRLAIDAVEVKIDPRAEWREIFDEVWRINRDYFYDPAMHGANWPAMKERYAQFLPHLATREDLARVIRWLCSELSVGHSFSGGGDTLVKSDPVPVGLLGADYEIVGGRYRFQKVLGDLTWTPDIKAPLREPGVEVKAGEFLLAVDGVDLLGSEEIYGRFENAVGKQVRLTVGPTPDGNGSRVVKVVPIANERELRHRDWVESNLRRVTEATKGRVAYVYVPNTADEGFVDFKRYFFPQSDREAIILDERFNGGGSVADYYIDILRRPYIANWTTRYGTSIKTPQAAIFGPKVMLIEENAGSGGDLLPWMFRKLGVGKLIGRRTWGGLVGILGYPELMDGGMVTAPNIGFWTEDEGYAVENVGVPPDIEVEQFPADCDGGRDPQLERAIQEVMKELEANPPRAKRQPPLPVRVRK